MKRTKAKNGITLVALVITIIVLLILAVVTINAISRESIIGYAKNATETYEGKKDEEQSVLSSYIDKIKEVQGIDGESVKISGSYILVDDVNENKHNLGVTLTSDSITDFSGITVKRVGQNLVNIDGLTAKYNGEYLDALVKNDDGTYTISKNEGIRSTQISSIFIPANTYFYLSATIVDTSIEADGATNLGLICKGSSEEEVSYVRLYKSGTSLYADKSATFNVKTIQMYIDTTEVDGTYVKFKDYQIALSNQLSYEPYNEQVATANSDGTVTGLTSVAPTMMLSTNSDDVTINLEYQKEGLLYNLVGKKIVNFGDSIYEDDAYPSDISTYLTEFTGATVYNAAFAGSRMSWHSENYIAFSMHSLADSVVSGDFSLQENAMANDSTIPAAFADAVARLKNINFDEIDIITIALGTNDFGASRPVETESNKYDKESFAGALRYSIETIKEEYPDIDIVLCTPIYRFWLDENNEFLYDCETYELAGNKLTDFVQKVKDVGVEYNLKVIDNYSNSGINADTREMYFPTNDGTHPNKDGRKMMALNIAKELHEEYK